MTPIFIADAMLGGLARWLRLLGFDTVYEAGIADAMLVRRAIEEDRAILTQDRRLPVEWHLPEVYLVQAEEPRAQLAEVVRVFDLGAQARLFTRCNRCNTALERLETEEIVVRVPPRVRERHRVFFHCPGCGRVYWHGSHTERIRRAVEQAVAGSGTDSEGHGLGQ